MSDTMPNLWAHSPLSPSIKTPLAILRAQTAPLAQATQGLLRGEVTVTPVGEKTVLTFDVIAPSLNNYRRRLVTVEHTQDEIYPAKITGNGLKDTYQETDSFSFAMIPRTKTVSRNVESKTAYSEDDFVKIIQELLQAPVTTALLQSLIARSNETTAQTFGSLAREVMAQSAAAGSREQIKEGNISGVQTGSHAVDSSGMPDTRGIIEKAADIITADSIDDKTGRSM